jgi:hypothetical protein
LSPPRHDPSLTEPGPDDGLLGRSRAFVAVAVRMEIFDHPLTAPQPGESYLGREPNQAPPYRPNFFVMVVFLFLSWVTVALRLWTRTGIIRSLGWDDGAMVVTLVRSSDDIRIFPWVGF